MFLKNYSYGWIIICCIVKEFEERTCKTLMKGFYYFISLRFLSNFNYFWENSLSCHCFLSPISIFPDCLKVGKRFFRSQIRSQFLSFPSNIHQRKSSYYDDYTFSFARKFARNRSQFSRFSEHPNGFFPFAFVINLAFKPKLLEQIFNFIHLLFIIQLVRQHIPQ